MARKYKVEGTNDYLIYAIFLGALSLWCIKDGWFPSPKVEAKHPRRVEMSFPTGGVIAEVLVQPEGAVNERQVVARLRRTEMEKREAEREESHRAAEFEVSEIARRLAAEQADAAEVERWRERLEAGRRELASRGEELARARADRLASDLRASHAGRVIGVLRAKDDRVEPGEAVVVLRPKDSFYSFNKTTAVLTMLGAMACLVIHFHVK